VSMPSGTTKEDPRSPRVAWECNTSAPELAAWLKACGTAVLLTHSKPDGDAAGSTLALARTLDRIGLRTEVWYVGPIPRWLDQIGGDTARREFAPARPTEPADGKPWQRDRLPDAIVVMDTGTWPQLIEMRAWLEPLAARTAVIDHHLHGDGEVGARRLIRTADAATAQVVAPLCCELLGLPAEKLPVQIAEPLYLGLATDTGWFRLSNVKPATMRLAASLLETGVDHTRLYGLIEQQDTAARWKLLGRALSTLELHDNDRIALMRLTLKDFQDCGADRNDTGGFADMVLSVATVRVVAIISEGETAPGDPPMTKVSMRSKPGPDAVDVNAATMKLGGGGHAKAAGAKMVGVRMDEAKQKVLGALR
jgi:phosphoesterase RecJ-like protein